MSKFLAVLLICINQGVLAQVPPVADQLPEVKTQVQKALQYYQKINPVAKCINSGMFDTQSPARSSGQIGNCVQQEVKNLTAQIPTEKLLNLPAESKTLWGKFKECLTSWDSFKNCWPQD